MGFLKLHQLCTPLISAYIKISFEEIFSQNAKLVPTVKKVIGFKKEKRRGK